MVKALMADHREILTDKSIARLCAGEKQYKVRDSELPGFLCSSASAGRLSWPKGSSGVMAFVNSPHR
jgi:hypothetical protein